MHQIIHLDKYDETRPFHEDRAAVRIGNYWGFIDRNGNEICEIRYDEVKDFQSSLAAVRKEGRTCYINPSGLEISVTNFMDEEMLFDGCKSCAIANHTISNIPGGYIYEDNLVNVTIDPEIPIKGFIVIGVKRHVAKTTMMTYEERMAIEKITHVSKCCLEKLGAKNILLFEDGFSEHYRRWIIQVSDWMFEYGRGKNLKQITMFAKNNTPYDEKIEILKYAEMIKKYFCEALKCNC